MHGLARNESDAAEPWSRAFHYAARVRANSLGAFSMVADATASSTFQGVASVAQLWASLPGFPIRRDVVGDVPRCLYLHPAEAPHDERPIHQRIAAPTHGYFSFLRDIPPAQLPENYPTTRGIERDGSLTGIFGEEQPVFRFVREDGTLRRLDEVGSPDRLDERSSLVAAARIVRPKVGVEAIGPPSEFLTLWALLFCLSELARYYPDTWVGALDPDQSPAAVTLERGLDLALGLAPRLIHTALGGPMHQWIAAVLEQREAEAMLAAQGAEQAEDGDREDADEAREDAQADDSR
jgi:hypothetical protein